MLKKYKTMDLVSDIRMGRNVPEFIISAKIGQEMYDALQELMSIVKIHSEHTGNNFAWAEMEVAESVISKAEGAE